MLDKTLGVSYSLPSFPLVTTYSVLFVFIKKNLFKKFFRKEQVKDQFFFKKKLLSRKNSNVTFHKRP